jgi:HK97 family phage major capsid protein
MAKTYEELLEERGRLVNQMQEISNANPDGFDSETKEKYERLDKAQANLKEQADRVYNEEKLNAEMAASFGREKRVEEAKKGKVEGAKAEGYLSALDAYIRKGQYSNALEVGADSEGGHLVSDYFDSRFREIRDDHNALRPFCDVIMTAGLHNIRVESTLGVSTWTDEEAAYTESDPAFGNVQLGAHKLGRIVKVSEELLQDSDFDIEAYLARAFGRSHGLAEEAAFIGGSGSGQPTGILSGAGAVTRTESPLNAAVTANTLLDVYYGLQRQYRSNATWIINDSTARTIRGITDGNDNFIWQPGLQAGQPDRILGRPYITSAYMPDEAESPLDSAVVFGDLTNYTIADRTGFRIQRLNELYAANGQVGFRGWSRVDGKTVQAAGIKKVAAF